MNKMLLVALLAPVAQAVDVSTVEGLASALDACDGSTETVITLAPGDYRLTSAQTHTDSYWGISHLYVKNKVTLRGGGTRREDVRLIGDGETGRVLYLVSGATVENLTITNGHVQAGTATRNAWGGAVAGSGGTMTNCFFIGNSSTSIAGAVGTTSSGIQLYDCVLMGNTAKSGGAIYGARCYNCLLACNTASGPGGAGYAARVTDCVVSNNVSGENAGGMYDSNGTGTLFIGNTANGSKKGGGAGTGDGGATGLANVYSNCTFVGNHANYGGAANRVILRDCRIYGNSATYGGATHNCWLESCVVSNNFASGHGGGIYQGTNVNCDIVHNLSSNTGISVAGGAYNAECRNARIVGNASLGTGVKSSSGSGGGTYGCTNYNCIVENNYSSHYGGGVWGGVTVGGRVSDNFCGTMGVDGPNANNATFFDCDVSGTLVSYGRATRTVFHDIGGTRTLTGNPYAEKEAACGYVAMGHFDATNCLFRDNTTYHGLLTGIDSDTGAGGSVTCCTIVSNRYSCLVRRQKLTERPLTFSNTLICGNKNNDGTVARDVHFIVGDSDTERCVVGALYFDHCAFGAKDASLDVAPYTVDSSLYRLGTDGLAADPRFCHAKDAAHPYALRASSPLIGLGKVEGWMADATDFRGEGFPRLREGNVDIGCYQCWLDPTGTMMIFR